MTFESLELRPQLLKTVAACGYTTPTPIQSKAIPAVIADRDVMGLAQTGTGKTAAFLLPIIQRLMQGPRGKVRTVIIAPTRELAQQISDEFIKLSKGTRLMSVTVYGGVAMGPQIQKVRRGAEVIVACPGRLLDHLGNGLINLSHVEVLVLDEADRMFDMGFLPDIKKIIGHLPAKRQNLMFSATMPPDIRRLAGEILVDPITVQVDLTAPAQTVSHALYPVKQHLKTSLLMGLLSKTDTESVLVFTRTKHRAKSLAEKLVKAGYRTTALQGNMTQNKRQEALDGFKRGRYQILVATDIAARGIDVSQISHVINFDMPDTADAYTHRIGRTGRAAKTGDAFTMITPEDAGMVKTIERILGSRPERKFLEGFDYAVAGPDRVTSDHIDRPIRGRFQPGGRPQGRPGSSNKPTGSRPSTHGGYAKKQVSSDSAPGDRQATGRSSKPAGPRTDNRPGLSRPGQNRNNRSQSSSPRAAR